MITESQYRNLGASGIKVSPIGTGTNKWWQGKNDEAVFQTYHSLVDAGVNFFDTAEVYSFGKSESLIGDCLKRDPRPVVIGTKYAPYPTRLLRRQFMSALDASLKRLNRQVIDLYYLHFPSPLPSIETVMDMMAKAVEAGKIRAVGVSNFSADQMIDAADRLEKYGIKLAANEVRYNLFHRQPEVNGVLDACRKLNVALVAYRPLEGGQLSVSPTSQKGKAASKKEAIQDTLQTIAQQRGKSVSQVTLNWMLRRDEHVLPIPGSTHADHALDNVDTLSWRLSDDEFAAIDQVSSPTQSALTS
ncbi:MAG: aldo/keto reductase [Candidatus Bathyarchaeia archaeon]|jgi:aryl-alcohol dehydrogenase-like predicted oxidoreductase